MHDEGNQKTNLKGGWVLLSNHFFYFGDSPVDLPEELLEIVKKGPGHKANFDPYYVDAFIHWIHSFGYPPATLIGKPQLEEPQWKVVVASPKSVCGPCDRQEDESDLEEPDSPPGNRC
jgi:Nucleotide modification associated domain 2